jgi:hypothetical protein
MQRSGFTVRAQEQRVWLSTLSPFPTAGSSAPEIRPAGIDGATGSRAAPAPPLSIPWTRPSGESLLPRLDSAGVVRPEMVLKNARSGRERTVIKPKKRRNFFVVRSVYCISEGSVRYNFSITPMHR